MITNFIKCIFTNPKNLIVTWVIVITLNQVFIFGACFAPYCLLAALPHTFIISAILIYLFTNDRANTRPKNNISRDTKKNRIHQINQTFDAKHHELLERLILNLESQGVNKSAATAPENKKQNFVTKEVPLNTLTHDTINHTSRLSTEVYITQSNATKITKQVRVEVNESDLDTLYDINLRELLSIPELLLLLRCKKVYENFTSLIHPYQKVVKIDNKDFVWEGASPAYHCDENCPRLHSEMTNLSIPPEIKHKGDIEIERFRKFVKEHQDLLKADEDKFIDMLEARFLLVNRPQTFKRDNSGVSPFEDYSLPTLKKQIGLLISDMDNFKSKDEQTFILIKNKGFGTDRIKESSDSDNPLYKWHHMKSDLKSLLLEYYKIRFNPKMKFQKSLLEQIGFVPCKHCYDLKK